MRDEEATRFPWTRHPNGSWSAHGYQIIRSGNEWRIIRDGQHWDRIVKLPDAKRACELDRYRRTRHEGRERR